MPCVSAEALSWGWYLEISVTRQNQELQPLGKKQQPVTACDSSATPTLPGWGHPGWGPLLPAGTGAAAKASVPAMAPIWLQDALPASQWGMAAGWGEAWRGRGHTPTPAPNCSTNLAAAPQHQHLQDWRALVRVGSVGTGMGVTPPAPPRSQQTLFLTWLGRFPNSSWIQDPCVREGHQCSPQWGSLPLGLQPDPAMSPEVFRQGPASLHVGDMVQYHPLSPWQGQCWCYGPWYLLGDGIPFRSHPRSRAGSRHKMGHRAR